MNGMKGRLNHPGVWGESAPTEEPISVSLFPREGLLSVHQCSSGAGSNDAEEKAWVARGQITQRLQGHLYYLVFK